MRSSSPIWLDGEPFQNLSRICNLIDELHRVIHQPNRKRPVTPRTDASHLVQVSGQAYTEAPSTFGEGIMGDSKAKRRISFSAMAIGLLLTSSPILARLFPSIVVRQSKCPRPNPTICLSRPPNSASRPSTSLPGFPPLEGSSFSAAAWPWLRCGSPEPTPHEPAQSIMDEPPSKNDFTPSTSQPVANENDSNCNSYRAPHELCRKPAIHHSSIHRYQAAAPRAGVDG